MSEPVEIVFDPHVAAALTYLLIAFLIGCGLAVYQIIDWMK